MKKLTTYIARKAQGKTRGWGFSALACLGLMAASCSSDQLGEGADALSGNGEKTPLVIETNLSAGPMTRAFDKTFEVNDKLFAYIEAGKMVGDAFTYEGQFHWANNFTMGETVDNGGAADVGNITTSDKLSPVLYWDDFSSTEYDLRSTDPQRGIRLKYGYCFNGGEGSNNADGSKVQNNITTALNKESGVLGWTVQTNQSTADAMKHSDLLYAATQNMIRYDHNNPETLVLPYTHAMSKITINVTTGESYNPDKENFADATLTLKHMQTKATVNAPAGEVTPSTMDADVQDVTTNINGKTNIKATYQAIVAPTVLSVNNALAVVGTIDGNTYTIPVTKGILEAWSAEDKMKQVDEVIYNDVAQAKGMTRSTIDVGKGYMTKPGIHYILDVTVDKQKITIRATITDWDSVTAEGRAAINFTGDVTEKGTIADELKTTGFDVYKSSTNDAFSEKSTAVTFVSDKWKYDPVIYWAGQLDNSYFRAVSPIGASTSTLTQGIDLMWGTSGDAAIAPRTGGVTLNFDHLMSKLCVKLETTSDASQVNLAGATIKITNLATTGSYSIINGTVSAGSTVETMLSGKASDFEEYVVPQTIGNDARLVITLTDGTTYSLQLNKCVLTDTETAVDEWLKGKSYTYTIHLEKEKITFRAVVKNWVDATGSGNANLEWD